MGTRALLIAAALVAALPAAARAEARMNFIGPKSVYAKIGMRTGDIVVNIDGVVPKSGVEVGQLIYARVGDGKAHKALIRRGAEFITLEFGP